MIRAEILEKLDRVEELLQYDMQWQNSEAVAKRLLKLYCLFNQKSIRSQKEAIKDERCERQAIIRMEKRGIVLERKAEMMQGKPC